MTSEDGYVNIDVNELVEKRRSPVGVALLIVNIIAFGMTIFQMYCAGFKTIDVMPFRAAHTGLGMAILFLIYPMTKKASRTSIPWYDWVLAFLASVPNFYIVFNFKALAARAGTVTTLDLIMGLLLVVLILEGARRVLGNTLVLISTIFILYTIFGKYFPGALAHRGCSLSTLVRHMILSTEGVFGVALGASASFIFLFCLLGALMAEIKADSVLIDIAVGIFGKGVGGPAKAAVLSSALFGTISGSSLANVTTTGTFTIPLMKKTGYEPEFAGAVEATASTGGQIMPPVMGAAAFIIAEFVGESYLTICIAAALPALLYFIGVFTAVHVKAKASGLKGIPAEELPNVGEVLKKKGYLLLPLVSIVVVLIIGMSPSMAAFIACLMTIALSWVKKETRMGPKRLFVAFANGAKGCGGCDDRLRDRRLYHRFLYPVRPGRENGHAGQCAVRRQAVLHPAVLGVGVDPAGHGRSHYRKLYHDVHDHGSRGFSAGCQCHCCASVLLLLWHCLRPHASCCAGCADRSRHRQGKVLANSV